MVEGTQSQRALSQRAGSTSPLSTRSKLLEDAWVQAPHPAADKGNGGSEHPMTIDAFSTKWLNKFKVPYLELKRGVGSPKYVDEKDKKEWAEFEASMKS